RRAAAPVASFALVPPAATDARASDGGVRLRWRRRVTARVRGPVTGRDYAVSAAAPTVTVDAEDAAGLLATGYFARGG
ncbi:hypothetical protein, partial [Microbacterium sp.]|uniref:hypothetical protein n=1 Tax=Microbacterium sp. TaxID=51671 RepID=UPI003A880640